LSRLEQLFPKCAPRIPEDPWIHISSGYFETYLFLHLKVTFCEINGRTSLTGDMFMPYECQCI